MHVVAMSVLLGCIIYQAHCSATMPKNISPRLLAARFSAHFFFPAIATAFPFLVRALFFVVCPLTGSCCMDTQCLATPFGSFIS